MLFNSSTIVLISKIALGNLLILQSIIKYIILKILFNRSINIHCIEKTEEKH